MGTLRLYLALCVLVGHADASGLLPFRIHGGREAVQIFFVISGFYMALVLDERYGSAKAFYVGRFARLFPAYAIATLAAVAASVAAGLLAGDWLALRQWSVSMPGGVTQATLVGLANAAILGQDALLFLRAAPDGGIAFTADFRSDQRPLINFLVLPQCWSVGIEIVLYLMAPVLVRAGTGCLVAGAIAIIAAKLAAFQWLGIAHDPWTYRFMPFEIGSFGLGIIAYRCCRSLARTRAASARQAPTWLPTVVAVAVPVLALLHAEGALRLRGAAGSVAPGAAWPRELAFQVELVTAAAGVCMCFLATRSLRWDRKVGDLSYPVYLLHLVIIGASSLIGLATGATAAIAAAATVAAAIALERASAPWAERIRRAPGDPPVAKPGPEAT